MKFPSLLVITLFATIAQAHDSTEYWWEAHVTDTACIVGVKAGLDFLTSDKGVHRHDIVITVFIVTPHPEAPNFYEHLSRFIDRPTLIQVQFLPSMEVRSADQEISDVKIEVAGRRIRLVSDSESGEKEFPVFVVGGEDADRAAESIQLGGELSVLLALGEIGELSGSIQSDQIDIASAMYKTCVKKVRETGLK